MTSAPSMALDASRVDLVNVLRNGFPDPVCVPGCSPWLLAGKRYLWPAPAGTGKSLAALTTAVAVVEHGGSVTILDVENGTDEYARRLADILTARDPDGDLADLCQERLYYHAWPQLSLRWTADDWVQANVGRDLVIIDSSRLALSSLGLAEDKADDYGRFASALIVPLARAGTATIALDNTGYGEQDRARGTSSKADLNEVVYVLKSGTPFDRQRPGHLRLVQTRSRFAGLPRELHIHLGGDTYTAPVVADSDSDNEAGFRPTHLMERTYRVLEANPGLSKRAVREVVRGKAAFVDLALELLIAEGHVEARQDGQTKRHYPLKPYTEDTDRVPVSQPCPNRVPDTEGDRVPVSPSLRGDTGHTSSARTRDTHNDDGYTSQGHPKCCCTTPDEPTDDGRCSRCWGTLPTAAVNPAEDAKREGGS